MNDYESTIDDWPQFWFKVGVKIFERLDPGKGNSFFPNGVTWGSHGETAF